MPDQYVILHSAPTLAGLKTGNLFSFESVSREEACREIRTLNRMLSQKGLRAVPIKQKGQWTLLYLYRPQYLEKDLHHPLAIKILKDRGYSCINSNYCLIELILRLSKGREFPHEIGLFLGYPPEDVQEFISNPCDGVQCTGCWKAFKNQEKAQETFQKFQRCTKIYQKANKQGKTLTDLAVKSERGKKG